MGLDFDEGDELRDLRAAVADLAGRYGHAWYLEQARTGGTVQALWDEAGRAGFLGVALPGEHGMLFRWLDSQLHEHGVQAWAALREGLRGQSFEGLAERLMSHPDSDPGRDPEADSAADAVRELRNVLDFMLDDALKARQSEAIAAAETDPSALERYRALEKRRLELRQRLKPATGGM